MADSKKVPETVKTKETVKINPLKNVTEEKVKTDDYQVEIIRDFDGVIDPFYLSKKDPDYAYRFLKNEQKNIALKTGNLLFQKGGWQICPRKHLEKLGLKEKDGIGPDGMLHRGDQILAFMPKKLFKEKEAHKHKVANEPMNTVKRLVKEGDSKAAQGIHHTIKGLQTKEQLGGSF